jgi:hypothetical protein
MFPVVPVPFNNPDMAHDRLDVPGDPFLEIEHDLGMPEPESHAAKQGMIFQFRAADLLADFQEVLLCDPVP